MESGCPERREVAAALAHLWRRAPLELLDYVAEYACEPEIRLSTGRPVRYGTHLSFTSYDDVPWTFMIVEDALNGKECILRLNRGQESILLHVPHPSYRFWQENDVGRIHIRPRYVVAAVMGTNYVFRREDGKLLHHWWPAHGSIGSELCVRVGKEHRIELCDLETGQVHDEWRYPKNAGAYCTSDPAIDIHDTAVWIPGATHGRSGGDAHETPSFRVPIRDQRFVRDVRSHVVFQDWADRTACIRGEWVYLASRHKVLGLHANGTRVTFALEGWNFAPVAIVSTPRTLLVIAAHADPVRNKCSAIRFTE